MVEFEGLILTFGTVDKSNLIFPLDCKIILPDKIPVTHNFNKNEIIGHADIHKIRNDIRGRISIFDSELFSENEYFIGGYYTDVYMHTENGIKVVDSCRLVSISIIPEHKVSDEKLKIRRIIK